MKGNYYKVFIEQNPWFIASYITKYLGYQDSNQTIFDLCDNYKYIDMCGYDILCIPKEDVYKLILNAKRGCDIDFINWVSGENNNVY